LGEAKQLYLVTADSDFVAILSQTGAPPQVDSYRAVRLAFPGNRGTSSLQRDSDLRIREGPPLESACSSPAFVEAFDQGAAEPSHAMFLACGPDL